MASFLGVRFESLFNLITAVFKSVKVIICEIDVNLCCLLGCANKDLFSLGPLRKFIEYCRIVELLPVIPLSIRNSVFSSNKTCGYYFFIGFSTEDIIKKILNFT